MTNEEAIEIKGEILNKVGEIRIGPVKICDNVVDITDVLDIINYHIDKKVRNEMTYGDIYNEFCKEFPNVKAVDYRPAAEMYIPELSSRGIQNAIVVWLKDGSKVIYITKSEDNE